MMGKVNFLTKEQQQQHYLKIHNGVFLSFHLSSGSSIACELKSYDCQKNSINQLLKEALSILGASISNVTCKIVGKGPLIHAVNDVLEENGIIGSKLVARDDFFEIIFLPKEGGVRLSKVEGLHLHTATRSFENRDNPLEKVKVMVIDDSKTIRNLLTKIFNSSPKLEVVAAVEDPLQAEDLIKKYKPDVITLDIHMPGINGVELLKRYYPLQRIPTIMVTSISIKEGPLVLEALEHGAFDYIQKPKMEEIKDVSHTLIEKVLEASSSGKKKTKVKAVVSKKVGSFNDNTLIVIGASTGGTNAIRDILVKLPANIPPIVIVQHIPAVFSKAFADRLNGLCPFTIKEAEDGDIIENNHVYIAEGGKQMRIRKRGGKLTLELTDDPPVNRFRPSVDYLFNSAEDLASEKNLVGVLLTGMGKDGAHGLLKLKNAGARTIAQDEESSVVFGMPREAIKLGGAELVSHLDEIPTEMARMSFKETK